jgi:hypothetical protein
MTHLYTLDYSVSVMVSMQRVSLENNDIGQVRGLRVSAMDDRPLRDCIRVIE